MRGCLLETYGSCLKLRHIAGIVNPPSPKSIHRVLEGGNQPLPADPSDWFAAATIHPMTGRTGPVDRGPSGGNAEAAADGQSQVPADHRRARHVRPGTLRPFSEHMFDDHSPDGSRIDRRLRHTRQVTSTLDQDHRAGSAVTTDLWGSAVVYQIYPRSFADSTGDGIGDLPGITSRVPYLQSLGVDAGLRLFYPSALADGGYDIDDHRDVDPRLGSLDDFDAMVCALHAADIKVIIDIVPNHTSNRHRWFRQPCRGPRRPRT